MGVIPHTRGRLEDVCKSVSWNVHPDEDGRPHEDLSGLSITLAEMTFREQLVNGSPASF